MNIIFGFLTLSLRIVSVSEKWGGGDSYSLYMLSERDTAFATLRGHKTLIRRVM